MIFGTEAEHLLLIVRAQFQVNAAVFAGVRLKKVNFTAFYSISTALNQNSLKLRVLKFGMVVEHVFMIVHAKFQVNAAVLAGASLKKGNFIAFYSIFTA